MVVQKDARAKESKLSQEASGGYSSPQLHSSAAYRGMLNFGLAGVLLLAAWPLILVAALLVKLTSRGPAFYLQTRAGRGGRPFTIFKLRTMFHECERWSGPRWSRAGDPRITPLGRLLRRMHVDELPQLWNVLRGDMNLVGPRPERPEIIAALEHAVPYYRERLQVRPGITGLAQVQLPADTDLESVRRKLAYDLYYVERGSLWLDVRLLVYTACYLTRVPVSLTRPVVQVPGGADIERSYEERINGEEAGNRRLS